MIGYGQKIITEGFVPVHDHFREIIAIAPVRMDVKIALVLVLGISLTLAVHGDQYLGQYFQS
ncbi:MAG: hypothetical protein OER04_12735 [Cyclobacteriaceae bacterium]|nr:hypothetical protein [Cyclobacteriaceae bacterium]